MQLGASIAVGDLGSGPTVMRETNDDVPSERVKDTRAKHRDIFIGSTREWPGADRPTPS